MDANSTEFWKGMTMRSFKSTAGRSEPSTTDDSSYTRTDLAVLFGVPIDNVSMAETIDRIADYVDVGRLRGRMHQITTVNVDFLVNAVEYPGLLTVLQRSALNLPDGMPVVWGSRLVGTPLTERVPGADLVPRLIKESASRGWRIHFFGGSEDVSDRAAAWVAERHPDATITFDPGPEIADVDEVGDEVIESIRNIDADIVCVGLGNPKQEYFIAKYGKRIGAPVMVGIGGSLDMLIGDRRRAPKWVQNTGLEWVFRAAQEPQRLGRRYLRDARVFTPHIVRYVPRVRKYQKGACVRVVVSGDGLSVRFGDVDDRRHTPSWRSTPQGTSPQSVHIDFNGVVSLDPAAHSTLVSVLRLAIRCNARITYEKRGPELDRCLNRYGTGVLVDDALSSGALERPAPLSRPIFRPTSLSRSTTDPNRRPTGSGRPVGSGRTDRRRDWR